jgi:hypothetical protein
MNPPDDHWRKLVNAAHRAAPEELRAPEPPQGFANRILNLRESIAMIARIMHWRRWSVVAALLCMVVFLIVFGFYRCSSTRAPLIETPSLPYPSP